ncbi:MAG: FAD-dependent oxidoreductase [Clostridia bacterium]|nr:FAD-dependent oxidoreductase [Clostridia bacterium]
MTDIIIIGGGPAGLTAALYARRANKDVLLLEKETFGGQITYSPKVENIPGFCEVTGNEFAEKLVEQVLAQGAEVDSCEVLGIEDRGTYKTVRTDSGSYDAKAVIVATGARHRTLGLEGEEAYIGAGVSFCAVCDGAFYTGKRVGVVGGGNSALQEALMLSDLASHVTVIQNLDVLTGEEKLAEALRSKGNVDILTGTVVRAYRGEGELSGVVLEHVADGVTSELLLDGLFVAVGLVPQNEPFASVLTLDERGYAVAGEDTLTKTPGIFVAGDCRTKRIRQVATAASDGAIAALAACSYVDDLR